MVDFIEILKTTLNSLVYKIKSSKVEVIDTNTFKISTCNTQYLAVGQTFVFNSNSYLVKEVSVNDYVVLQGVFFDIDFTIRQPLFIVDTPKGADNELNLQNHDINRHPFIWLLETFETDIEKGTLNSSESFVKIYFLTCSDNNTWLHETHHKNCLMPMKNLAVNFIKEIEKAFAGRIEDFKLKNLPRFGVYKTDPGASKHILNEQLSGVELTAKIPVRRWAETCSC